MAQFQADGQSSFTYSFPHRLADQTLAIAEQSFPVYLRRHLRDGRLALARPALEQYSRQTNLVIDEKF